MKEKSSIEQKIDKAISSIDDIQRATPVPFFYTRLMARLNADPQSSWGKLAGFIARPAIAFATILLVIFINVFAIYQKADTNISSSDSTEVAAVDEYSQVTGTIYDIENNTP
ncbi:MAG: hypothetical protein ABJA57_09165 [Ginsengibacter sp.]